MGFWRNGGNRAGVHVLAAAGLGVGALLAGLCHRWVASRDAPPTPAEQSAPPGGSARLPEASPEATGADPGLLRQASEAVAAAVRAGTAPGAVLLVGHRGRVVLHEAFGTTAPTARRDWGVPVTRDTLFDLASLTKVVATAPAIHLLAERGEIGLTAPVARYLPSFAARGKGSITVAQLLTHSAGLPPTRSYRIVPGFDRTRVVTNGICELTLRTRSGTRTRYSDLGFILLGEMVRAVTGKRIDVFTRESLFEPLGMCRTGYRPMVGTEHVAAGDEGQFAATVRGRRVLRGEVQDPTAAAMGGVAGHAGLFGTASDLALYAQMLLNGGDLGDVRIFRTATVERMLRVSLASPDRTRTLGWDHSSRFASPKGGFGDRSFGHTGWTGTSIWIDPEREGFVILLTNSAHVRRIRPMKELRAKVSALVARALPVAHLETWKR